MSYTNLTDKQIELIIKAANSKEIIKECEPNVSFPMEVKGWMVRRVLRAYEKVTKCEVGLDKVYVAHVYGKKWGLSDDECEENVKHAIEIARQLILKGYNPYVPLLLHWVSKDWEDRPPEKVFGRLVEDWIEHCPLFLLGSSQNHFHWDISGEKKELEIAQSLNKAIFYDVDDLPKIIRGPEDVISG